MKKVFTVLTLCIGVFILSWVSAQAATILFPGGGGTGWGYPGGIQAHSLPIGNNLSPFSTTSPGSAGQVLTSNGANADPTFQSISSGVVSTSTNETSGFLPYWTSNSATPALLGKVGTTSPTLGTGLAYSGTLGALVGGASGQLTIATSSLFSGSTGQFPYFSAANTLTATSSIFIATSGQIGIGTTTPAATLDINQPSQTNSMLTIHTPSQVPFAMRLYNDTFGSTTPIFSYFPQNNGTMIMGTDQNNTLGFYTNGFSNVRLTVGSVNITTPLYFNASATGKPLFVLNSSGSNFGLIENRNSTSWDLGYGTSATSLGTPDLTWNDSGNVGVATTSPYAKLSVMASADYASHALSTVFAIGSSTAGTATTTLLQIDSLGHRYTGGATPSVSGGTSTVSGNDNNGTITVVGTLLTSVTLTFANAWKSAPDCTMSDSTTGVTAGISSISTTQLVVAFSAGVNSGTVWYQCAGHI